MEVVLGKSKLEKENKLNGNLLVNQIYKGSQTGKKLPCSLCEEAKLKKVPPIIHFHGSGFGACLLKQQLGLLNLLQGQEQSFDDLKLYSFEDGHLHEASMLTSLENYGHPIDYKNVEIQKTYYDQDTKEEILVVGHPDARIQKDFKHYIIECKAVKEYAYRKYLKEQLVPLIYYAQAQVYTDMLDADGAMLLIKNRNSSEIQTFVLDRNPDYIKAQIRILGAIQNAIKEKRLLEKPYDQQEGECRYCFNQSSCWK